MSDRAVLPPLDLDPALQLEDALDLDDARRAAQAIARNRRTLVNRLITAIEEAATAEDHYRKKLATRIAKLRDSYPATVCEVMAKGEDQVITLRHKRDVARDIKEKVIPAELRGMEGERAILRQLTEWSQQLQVDPARAVS